MEIDNELDGLSRLALCNAFYEDFSDLVNKYLKLGEGLNPLLEQQLSDMANVFSRDDTIEAGDIYINMWALTSYGLSYNVESFIEALENKCAIEVHLQGNLIFKCDDTGEWMFVEKDT
jgi:hypothetical protein